MKEDDAGRRKLYHAGDTDADLQKRPMLLYLPEGYGYPRLLSGGAKYPVGGDETSGESAQSTCRSVEQAL